MRTATEINVDLVTIAAELVSLDTQRFVVAARQRELWAERAKAEVMEEFVRLPKDRQAEVATAITADLAVRAELEVAEEPAPAEDLEPADRV